MKMILNIKEFMLRFSLYIILSVIVSITNVAYAYKLTFKIDIKDHKFIPDVVKVPAGEKFDLHITNLDSTPEEFESLELHREKIIPANSTVRIGFAPMETGAYSFFGEFHPESAQGKLIVE